MLLRVILVLWAVVGISFAEDLAKQYQRDFDKLNSDQLKVLREIYQRTKPYDLVYTALAIAWQESNFGKWKVNLQDPSCGIFQQSVYQYARRYKINPTNFNVNRICSSLLNDIDLTVATFIAEIETWKELHAKRWNKWNYVYRSYNAGNNYSSTIAKEYARKVEMRIRILKKNLHKVVD